MPTETKWRAVLKLTLILLGLFTFVLLWWWPKLGNQFSPVAAPPTKDTGAELPEVPSTSLGQHFIIGHWANTTVASTTELIEEYQLAGVIIMSPPEDPEEIKNWTTEWQAASPTPLLIGIDQEGGVVSRLKGPGFIQTSQREVTTAENAYQVGFERGQELAGLGINMVFAPVLDTANNPDSFMYKRVFPDREQSAALAAAMIKGFSAAGVTAVPKHFPGHDDTEIDSHLELPVVNIPESEISNFITPFSELLKNNPPEILMTAHVSFPSVDSLPATLSPYWLQTVLRNQLNYQGKIITDDMSMAGITSVMPIPEAAATALKAGADLILLAAEPEEIITVMEYLSTK